LLRLAIALAALTASSAAAAPDVGAPPSHPSIQVGVFPTGIVVNGSTHTVYVGNGTSGTLSLIDGRTCNAVRAGGCGRLRTAVTAGTDPIGIAVAEATNTVYVVNFSGTVAVVNGGRCNAAHTSGCGAALATVTVGAYPQFLAVDDRTQTVYVANSGSNTVSVIDGRRCNATTTSGCRRVRASVSVGPVPFTLAVNPVTSSIYVTDLGAHTVSVIDGKTCNATVVRGCHRKPVTVNVGETPGGIAVDTRTNTVYVTGESSSDVSVIDGRTCNATRTSGCRRTRHRGRRVVRHGLRGEHRRGLGERDRRFGLQRDRALRLRQARRDRLRRLEPAPRRRRRAHRHRLRHERRLELRDDARRPHLQRPCPHRLLGPLRGQTP
jgi:YVTN family beta-propeller protein